jgi:hypothetical protein
MPARPSGKFRCFCVICSASCGTGPDGTPLGKFILESQRIPHLARAKAEIQIQSDIRNAAASLFASTLVDDGPNPHAQSSRLWSSREGHQSSASRLSLESETLPINTIIESFQRLQSSTPVQPVSGSFFPPESQALPFNTVYPEIQDSTPVQPVQSAPPSGSSQLPSVDIMTEARTSKRSTKSLDKRELSKLTKSAHRTLDHVEHRTRHWFLHMTSITMAETLADAEHDIGRIQTAFDNVKRDVQSVNARKATIGHSLTQLQSRLVELRRLYPFIDDKPLQFDSSKYLLFLCI